MLKQIVNKDYDQLSGLRDGSDLWSACYDLVSFIRQQYGTGTLPSYIIKLGRSAMTLTEDGKLVSIRKIEQLCFDDEETKKELIVLIKKMNEARRAYRKLQSHPEPTLVVHQGDLFSSISEGERALRHNLSGSKLRSTSKSQTQTKKDSSF